jgi:hypothetical protein
MSALLLFVGLLPCGLRFLPLQNPVDGTAKADQAFARLPRDTGAVVEAVEQVADGFVPLHHGGDGSRFVDAGLVAVGIGILAERVAQVLGDADVIDDQPAGLVRNTRFTRAMACISPCPRIGLSMYIVCIDGASKPVSHMSRTMTSERIIGILRTLGEVIAPRLAADMRLPVRAGPMPSRS